MDKHAQDKARGNPREIMKGAHGRGQKTAGDREIVEPKRAPTK